MGERIVETVVENRSDTTAVFVTKQKKLELIG